MKRTMNLLILGIVIPVLAACGGGGNGADVMLPATGKASATPSVPKVILDGDVGPDPCDFATLAMAHNLHRAGEIELLGFMATMPESSDIQVIDILNQWYGHSFPIGVFKDPSDQGYSLYVQTASAVSHELFPASRIIASHYAAWAPRGFDSVPSSTELYRKLLAAQDDRSVTLLALGQLYNVKALLNSGPDQYSPLTGMELVQAKVVRIVAMIGGYAEPMTPADLSYYNTEYFSNPPNTYGALTVAMHASSGNGYGAEYNAHAWYPGLTRGVFDQLNELNIPKVILGNEQGWKVPAGAAYNELPVFHPVRMAYYENNIPSKEIHPYTAKHDPAYDELALLYLARGKGKYFEELAGHVEFDELGTSTWKNDPLYQHTRLILTPTANQEHELSRLIESLVLGDKTSQEPVGQQGGG